MTKAITADMRRHLDGAVTSLASCWRITRTDGRVFAFTGHDRDLVIQGTTYVASSSFDRSAVESNPTMSVDNLEIQGVFDDDSLRADELRGGLFDRAEVELFLVNWADLSMGRIQLRRGWLGEVTLTPSGIFKSEIRGLIQALQQNVGEVYTTQCRADLGDARCRVPVNPPVLVHGQAVRALEFYRVKDRALPDDGSSAVFHDVIFQVLIGGTTIETAGSTTMPWVHGSLDPPAEWDPYRTYEGGDRVTYAAAPWKAHPQLGARTISTGVPPGGTDHVNGVPTTPWAPADAAPAEWSPTEEYSVDDVVTVSGDPWTARPTLGALTISVGVAPGQADSVNGTGIGAHNYALGTETQDGTALFLATPAWSRYGVVTGFQKWTSNSAVETTVVGTGRVTVLAAGATMALGASVVSGNGLFKLVFTPGGDLVLYRIVPIVGTVVSTVWVAGTADRGATTLTMQDDGDLVMRDADGTVLFSTFTDSPGSSLLLLDQGLLAVFSSGVSTDSKSIEVLWPYGIDQRIITGVSPGSVAPSPQTWFNDGVLTWETGRNVGVSMEVQATSIPNPGGTGDILTLHLPMGFAISAGDKFRVYPGCSKLIGVKPAALQPTSNFGTLIGALGDPALTVVDPDGCFPKFRNAVNFRGEPFIPGVDFLVGMVSTNKPGFSTPASGKK